MSVTTSPREFDPLSAEFFTFAVDEAGLRGWPTSPRPSRSAGFREADGRVLDHR